MMYDIETLLGHLEELFAEDLAVLHAELDVEEVRPNQLLDLASQLRGVGVLLGIWRREEARDAPAVHRFGRIAWRHTDHTRPLVVTSQHIPDSGQADGVGVGGPPLGVGVSSAEAKAVEPQPAGASARGHHLPGGDGDWGVAATQRAVDAVLDHPGEVRHLLQHPPKEQLGWGGVQSYDDHPARHATLLIRHSP